MIALLLLLLLRAETPPPKIPAPAKNEKPSAVPPGFEVLHYSVNWPSGLSLGELAFRTTQSKSGAYEMELTLEAGVPGFAVTDKYRTMAGADLCTASLEKSYQHGQRRASEKITFDQEHGTVTRETQGGGKSTREVGKCAHDLASFLQLIRRELAQGRVPQQQDVVFGASYNVRLDYKGTASVKVGGAAAQSADWMIVTVKGPRTDITFDLFFAKDAVRTPLQVRVPLALGVLSADLQR
jgi:hypothetical protein